MNNLSYFQCVSSLNATYYADDYVYSEEIDDGVSHFAEDGFASANAVQRTRIVAEFGAQSQQEPQRKDFGPGNLPALQEYADQVGRWR